MYSTEGKCLHIQSNGLSRERFDLQFSGTSFMSWKTVVNLPNQGTKICMVGPASHSRTRKWRICLTGSVWTKKKHHIHNNQAIQDCTVVVWRKSQLFRSFHKAGFWHMIIELALWVYDNICRYMSICHSFIFIRILHPINASMVCPWWVFHLIPLSAKAIQWGRLTNSKFKQL